MHNVKSKYKNPDKFIKTLQAEIERYEDQAYFDQGRIRGLYGESIITWGDNTKHQGCGTSCNLGNLHVNDKIAMIGRVVKVVESTCDTGNRESSIDYKLLETRRIKE